MLIFFGSGSKFIQQRYTLSIEGVALSWAIAVTAIVYFLGVAIGAVVFVNVILAR